MTKKKGIGCMGIGRFFFVSAAFFLLSTSGTFLRAEESQYVKVIEDPGLLLVVHGSDCGSSQKKGEQNYIEKKGSITAPQWANQATVFLNGWQAEYLEEDHHFGEIKVLIYNIKLAGGILTWDAIGFLADEDFDDPYKFCYHYTALFWNDKKLGAQPFHNDGGYDVHTGQCKGNLNWMDHKSVHVPMLSLPSYLENQAFSGFKGVAVLPRGFNLSFLPYGKSDNHLLQIAYNFSYSESFVGYPQGYGHLPMPSLPNNASRVGSGYVSWRTQSIFKDNDDASDFRFWEHVSAIGGDDIGVIQPPFAILPVLHQNVGCVFTTGGLKTEEYIIERIPYEYAVPVLTGWDLHYQCPDDEEVLQIGVWLHDISYSKKPSDPYGTLKYKISSVLVDDDKDPGHEFNHRVHILGLKGIIPAPDLLPVQPDGVTSYCRKDSSGRLSVTIRNQGKVDAPASTTTIDFFPVAYIDVYTPPIPAGGEVTILTPPIPGGCFIPNCRFKIRVDSKQVVKEANENNNDVNGECKG